MKKKILLVIALLALVISGCATYGTEGTGSYNSAGSPSHSSGCH